MKGLGTRVVSGVVLLALVLAAIWLQGPLLMLAVALAAALGAHEFYGIARRAGYSPWYPAGVALSLLLALRAYLGDKDLLSGVIYTGPGTGVEITVIALVLVMVLVQQGIIWGRAAVTATRSTQVAISTTPSVAPGWSDLGLTLGGAIYTGGLLGYAPLLASIQEGPARAGGTAWLLAVIACTAACDTGAYFAGNLLGKRRRIKRNLLKRNLVRGKLPKRNLLKRMMLKRKLLKRNKIKLLRIRHKLIPHISPAKTWEGLVGGVLGPVIAAVALSGLLKLSLGVAVVLGLLICAAAVAGDLCESLLKRAARVKDSGNLIPGHGGILDRVDSILFVLLAVYWFTQVA